MSDIELKNIPVLDDIIEQDFSELEDSARRENLSARADDLDIDDLDLEQENNFNLFALDLFSADKDQPDDLLAETSVGNFGVKKEASNSDEQTDKDSTFPCPELEFSNSLDAYTAIAEHDHNLAMLRDVSEQDDIVDLIQLEVESSETEYINIDTDDLHNENIDVSNLDFAESAIKVESTDYDEIADDLDDGNVFESALISFNDENEAPLSEPESISTADETIHIDFAQETSLQQLTADAVDNMVDNIVKQLLPDLEAQLRHLVKQSLDDNLTEAIRKSFATDD